MKIGIIGAMDPEVDLLISELKNPKKSDLGFCKFAQGTLEEQEVIIARSGIGKVCAGAVTALMINVYKADVIINTGSAGGIAKGLKVGDTVLSDKVSYHDCDLTIFGYEIGQMAAHDRYFMADADLVEKARKAAEGLKDFSGKIVIGTTLSGDQFISSPEKKKWLTENFDNAMVTEMEGAAIAQVASDFKVPFLVIRAVSDSAEEGSSITYDEFMPLAAKNSALLVKALLREL